METRKLWWQIRGIGVFAACLLLCYKGHAQIETSLSLLLKRYRTETSTSLDLEALALLPQCTTPAWEGRVYYTALELSADTDRGRTNADLIIDYAERALKLPLQPWEKTRSAQMLGAALENKWLWSRAKRDLWAEAWAGNGGGDHICLTTTMEEFSSNFDPLQPAELWELSEEEWRRARRTIASAYLQGIGAASEVLPANAAITTAPLSSGLHIDTFSTFPLFLLQWEAKRGFFGKKPTREAKAAAKQNNLIELRKTLLQRIQWLYSKEPKAPEELQAIAQEHLGQRSAEFLREVGKD